MEECLETKKVWDQVLKNETIVCVLGEMVSSAPDYESAYEHSGEDEFSDTDTGWIIDRVKTRNGCWSYFLGTDCQL